MPGVPLVLGDEHVRGRRTDDAGTASVALIQSVEAGLAAHRGDAGRAIARAREAVALVREGAAALDGVLSIGALGRLLVERGDIEEGRALQEEAADLIEARLADLKGPDLRRGYLELADVRAILGAVARLPAA